MTKVLFDDIPYEVDAGLTVLEAAKQAGIEIPHFCYHPALPIDGNCRMCLVEIDKMPKPVISCKTPIAEGMSVRTKTENVQKMRQSVMEFLLLNHPLDCPECDQAGECRLQEYHMNYNLHPSRLGTIRKGHKPKAIEIGPRVMFDAERCILCTRCIRFCNEITKTGELYTRNRGTHSEITTFPGKPLDNDYSMCTVDLCPVGALTSTDFRFKKRVWFLKETESVCTGCATGCNIFADHEGSTVYRYRPRYNKEVNGYFMCDEGRLSYKDIDKNRLHTSRFKGSQMSTALAIGELTSFLEGLLGSRSAELAVIVSAGQKSEDLEAIAKFRNDHFPQAAFYYTRREPENPKSDNFLIHADKNPNTAVASTLPGIAPLSQWKNGPQVVVAFGELGEKEAASLSAKNLKALIAFASVENPLTKAATLVLPIPTHFEESGSFTNAKGLSQSFSACFDPPASVLPISSYLGQIIDDQALERKAA